MTMFKAFMVDLHKAMDEVVAHAEAHPLEEHRGKRDQVDNIKLTGGGSPRHDILGLCHSR